MSKQKRTSFTNIADISRIEIKFLHSLLINIQETKLLQRFTGEKFSRSQIQPPEMVYKRVFLKIWPVRTAQKIKFSVKG